jgi:hypothetical protein
MADDKRTTQLTGAASLRAGTYIPGEGYQATPAQKAAAGPQPEPQTVAMDVLRDGSFAGETHHAGDTIDVPEHYVEALSLSGFAARADRVETAQAARDARAQDAEAAKADAEKKAAAKGAKRSTAVKPLGTADVPGAAPPNANQPQQASPPAPQQASPPAPERQE